MTFYVKPLLGSCPLSQLVSSSCVRLSYLHLLYQQRDSLDCVAEKVVDSGQFYEEVVYGGGGSQWDRLSHFTLMVAASLDQVFREFWVEAECLLFNYRLEREMMGKEVITSVRRLGRHLEEFMDGSNDVWGEVFMAVKELLGDRLLQHWVECRETECRHGNTLIPFTMVLPLVRVRRVAMSLGRAQVNCRLLQSTLGCIFRKIINTKLDILSKRNKEGQLTSVQRVWSGMLEGGNIKNCFAQIFGQFRGYKVGTVSSRRVEGGITADMVEGMAMYFPPCIALLYRELMRERKLKHEDRFQLSLFLKDIGMGVEEQCRFWAGIYSRYKTGGPGGNLWADRSAKYRYGIRHMYGLEGRRVEYKSKTCMKVMVGGGGNLHCPLVGEVEDIAKYLRTRNMNSEKKDKVVLMCKEGKARMACGSLSGCGVDFAGPAQLFLVARRNRS